MENNDEKLEQIVNQLKINNIRINNDNQIAKVAFWLIMLALIFTASFLASYGWHIAAIFAENKFGG